MFAIREVRIEDKSRASFYRGERGSESHSSEVITLLLPLCKRAHDFHSYLPKTCSYYLPGVISLFNAWYIINKDKMISESHSSGNLNIAL